MRVHIVDLSEVGLPPAANGPIFEARSTGYNTNKPTELMFKWKKGRFTRQVVHAINFKKKVALLIFIVGSNYNSLIIMLKLI